MNANTTSTTLPTNNTYVKVAGTTTSTKLLKFSSPTNNRLTYLGKDPIVASFNIIVSGKSPTVSASLQLLLTRTVQLLPVRS